MSKRNPYAVDRYADTQARGGRGALAGAAGMLGCVLAMAVLCLGMIYVLWKAAGR